MLGTALKRDVIMANVFWVFALALLSKETLATQEPHTFEKPLEGTSGLPGAALIWIQGAQVPASNYKPLLKNVQVYP